MNEEQVNGSSEEDRNFVAPETGNEESVTKSELPSEEQPEPEEAPVGFTETAQMAELRQQMVEAAAAAPEKFDELALQWKHLADEQATSLAGEQYDRAMIQILMGEADIFRSIGREGDYYEDLNHALDYAYNMGFEDLVVIIETKLGG